MSFDRDLLRIYVADHRAAAAGVAQRLGQMTAYTHLSFAHEIDQMHRDVIAEGKWVEEFAARYRVQGGTMKRGGARIAERLGRLKLNGRLRSTSPLSPLIETEMLIAAVTIKIAFLQTLAVLSATDDDADELAELLEQAHEHFERATNWHRQLRSHAFTVCS